MPGRKDDLRTFYGLMNELENRIGGARCLSECHGRMDWPQRGVYFFHERDQVSYIRESIPDDGADDSISGELESTGYSRVTRIGTHALKKGSRTSLWNRLSQHKGQVKSGGGNHRGSIFRLLVGTAVIETEELDYPTWGVGSTAPREIRQGEHLLEEAVSDIIGDMPFLWLAINDEPGPDSLRGYIERNSIALLSDYNRPRIDTPDRGKWLGHFCDRELVRKSDLWNQNHVEEAYDPAFLKELEKLINQMEKS